MSNLRRFLFVFAAAIILSSHLHSQQKNPPQNNKLKPPEYLPDEILVVYKSNASEQQITSMLSSKKALAVGEFFATHEKKRKVKKVKIKKGRTVAEVVADFRKNPLVEHAQPNYIYRSFVTTPNDTDFGSLWGLKNTGQSVNGASGTADADIDADYAWDITTGTNSVIVAVIDSGVVANHPDLSTNIWAAGGYDYFDNDSDVADYNGHGTHVAGTIGAIGNNSSGISGVNWRTKIIPIKVFGVSGSGYTKNDALIQAINHAVTGGAKIINASLGGHGGYDGDLTHQAIQSAGNAGVLFVAAAGNDTNNNDANPAYPASYNLSNIISVAATDQNDNLASFSNYGATKVHLAAPGKNIYSTVATYTEGSVTEYSTGFDGDYAGDWIKIPGGNSWGINNAQRVSLPNSLDDSPGVNYANNLVSTQTFVYCNTPVNYTKDSKYFLNFKVRADLENSYDFLDIIFSDDKTDWHPLYILTANNDDRITGTSGGDFVSLSVEITKFVELGIRYFGFGISSDAFLNYDGVYIDDVSIVRKPLSVNTYTLEYNNGTSMAAPHAAGIAALALAVNPNLTVSQLRSAILTGVDVKSSLSGKVSTGGRVNAFKTLMVPATPTNLTGTVLSTGSISWTWTSSTSNEKKFIIKNQGGSAMGEVASGINNWTQSGLGPNATSQVYIVAYNSATSDGGEFFEYTAASALSQEYYTLANLPSVPIISVASKSEGIVLSWGANGNPSYTRWRIERAKDAAEFSSIVDFDDEFIDTTYTDGDIAGGATYYYRVAALNGNSVASAFAAAVSTYIATLDPKNPSEEPTLAEGEAGVQYVGTGADRGYFNPSAGEKVNIYFMPLSDGIVKINIVPIGGSSVYTEEKSVSGGRPYYFEWRGNFSDGKSAASGIYPVLIEGAGIRKIKKLCVIR